MKVFCAINVLAVAFLWWGWAGYRLNTTLSMPRGIYKRETFVRTIQRGDLVVFCLESEAVAFARERGYLTAGECPSGLKPLLKHVEGLPGDQVGIDSEGIEINGHMLAGSKRAETDSHGRPMPSAALQPGVIPPGSALVLSGHHPSSFDSRYFGLVSLDSLRPVKAVLTF